jgi:hypothetical protein
LVALCSLLAVSAIALAVVGVPRIIIWVPLILIAPCAIAAYVLASVAAKRARVEQDKITARGLERIKHMNFGGSSGDDERPADR